MSASGAAVWITFLAGCPDTGDDSGQGEELDTADIDGDGYSRSEGDCDDSDGSISPEMDEHTGNTVDEDCNGTRFASTPVAEATGRLVGTEAGMNFGYVVFAAPAELANTRTVAVAEPGWGGDGPGSARMFDPAAAAAAAAGRTASRRPHRYWREGERGITLGSPTSTVKKQRKFGAVCARRVFCLLARRGRGRVDQGETRRAQPLVGFADKRQPSCVGFANGFRVFATPRQWLRGAFGLLHAWLRAHALS